MSATTRQDTPPKAPDELVALAAAARALPKPEVMKALRQSAELQLDMSQGRTERLEAQGFLLLVELGERAAAALKGSATRGAQEHRGGASRP